MSDEEFNSLFRRALPLLEQYQAESHAAIAEPLSVPVHSHLEPLEVAEGLEHLLHLPEQGKGADAVIDALKKCLKYSVRTSHPLFLDKLYAGSSPVGQLASLVEAVLNTNVHCYDVAPVFSVLEREVLKEMARLAGYDMKSWDGVLCPGGSYSNMVGMILARDRVCPSMREEGFFAATSMKRPVVFASEHSHYSNSRNAMICGLGRTAVIKVKSTLDGSMLVEDLKLKVAEALKNDQQPFLVVATAGTTVMAGFDPLRDISAVCTQHDMWLHVDASWGGTVLFSSKHRPLMDGIELADSLTWNPHKGMGIPLQASAFLTRHKGVLAKVNCSKAHYLFHGDDEYDLGEKTLQCGRKPDSLKIWMDWIYRGTTGYKQRIELAFDNTKYLASLVDKHELFELVTQPQSLNVCFWYISPSLRKDLQTYQAGQCNGNGVADCDDEPVVVRWAKQSHIREHLADATRRINHSLQKKGSVLMDFSPLPCRDLPHFFRCPLNAPTVTSAHLDVVMEELTQAAAKCQL